MAMFSIARPTSLQPKRHEGSALRSVRDSDNVAKSWVKNQTQQKQNNSDGQALARVQAEVLRMRRRIVGGGSGFNWNSTKEFLMANDFVPDTGGSYGVNDVVTVSPENIATIESVWLGIHTECGYIDPDAGYAVFSRPGTYVCLQACDGTHIPQWPAPAPNDINDPLNFWWPISGLKPFRGTWGQQIIPGHSGFGLGISSGFCTRFADGDVVLFNYQQNTPGPQQFMIPFFHIGNTLNETVLPNVADISGSYTNTYSQSKWACSGFSWLSSISPFNTATIIPGF